MPNDSPKEGQVSPMSGCEEHDHLLDELGEAIRELLKLHEEQLRAVIECDSDSSRFDNLIHKAKESRLRTKQAYARHVEEHGCADFKSKARSQGQ
jgi:hypothetical protein